ncbi:hypothetical protein PRUPE_3G265100 [Prunus persica]|uniref:Uncharacterized protein n=1 Tax=Prunus persica TaxID=3760 RepID=M5XDX4_PRUPE|nr:hypothetical protein PRUPE_3G265100 [Prunus persica]
MRVGNIKGRYGRKSSLAAILNHHHTSLNPIFDDLPDVVLVEILCRLRCYKLVYQCKCVSKRWCTLITDPYFIGRFVSLQREYHHQQTPIILINKKRDLLNRMSDPLKPFFRRFKKFHGSLIQQEPEVAGAYNDLLLCYTGKYYERNYYICNPYTQQWIALPAAPPCHEQTVPLPEGFMCDLPLYNKYTNDDDPKRHNSNNIAELNTNYRCKVVRLICPCYGKKYSKFKVQIFSSETGQWRETIVSSPQDIMLGTVKFHICFANACNRMLYWMGGVHFLLELDPFMINNGDYKCRLINLRDHHFDGNIILSCLGVYGGRLKMFDFELTTNTFLVWDVNVNKEEYHGGFEKVCLENMTSYILEEDMVRKRGDVLASECMALDPNNEEIIYLVIDYEIVMFNIRTRIQSKLDKKYTTDYGLNCGFFQVVVPWWPTPVPRLPQDAHAHAQSTKNQSKWEEEMGKVM